MKRKTHYGSLVPYTDLFLNCLVLFIMLFAIAIVQMKMDEVSKKKVEAKAEFIITISWPISANDDVDSYLEDPLGNLIGFQRREQGLMHLDRDDYGDHSDVIQTPHGPISYPENREVLTIRGIIPGEYTCWVHMYSKRTKMPAEVTVQVDKINPMVQTISIKKYKLHVNGDYRTACRFILNKEGEVTKVFYLSKKLPVKLNHSGSNAGSFGDDENYNEGGE